MLTDRHDIITLMILHQKKSFKIFGQLFFFNNFIRSDSLTGAGQEGIILRRKIYGKVQVGSTMPVMDEFKKEREKLKGKSFKEKWDYFWYYYKMHVLVIVCALILLVTTIRDIMTQKDYAFYVAFLNSFATEQDEIFIDEFAQLTDIDFDKYQIYLDTHMRFNVTSYDQASMAAAQKFLAMSSAGEIDVVVSDRDVFASYADNGFFYDLRNYLTEEQIAKYSDHFFYFDAATLDDEIDYNEVYSSEMAIPPDTTERRDPSSMEQPLAVGIFLDDEMNDKLTEIGYFGESQEVIFGIMGSEENKIYCQQFIDWLVGN